MFFFLLEQPWKLLTIIYLFWYRFIIAFKFIHVFPFSSKEKHDLLEKGINSNVVERKNIFFFNNNLFLENNQIFLDDDIS